MYASIALIAPSAVLGAEFAAGDGGLSILDEARFVYGFDERSASAQRELSFTNLSSRFPRQLTCRAFINQPDQFTVFRIDPLRGI